MGRPHFAQVRNCYCCWFKEKRQKPATYVDIIVHSLGCGESVFRLQWLSWASCTSLFRLPELVARIANDRTLGSPHTGWHWLNPSTPYKHRDSLIRCVPKTHPLTEGAKSKACCPSDLCWLLRFVNKLTKAGVTAAGLRNQVYERCSSSLFHCVLAVADGYHVVYGYHAAYHDLCFCLHAVSMWQFDLSADIA